MAASTVLNGSAPAVDESGGVAQLSTQSTLSGPVLSSTAANDAATPDVPSALILPSSGADLTLASRSAVARADGALEHTVAGTSNTHKITSKVENDKEPEELDIVINNVVSSFSVRCHLNLREIALNGANVEYRRDLGMVTMKMRRPYTTAAIRSSGKITCTGAVSEDQAKIAARRYARILQKLGFHSRFTNFRIVNVLGSCSLPFGIKIVEFSMANKSNVSYEPELHPGATYRMKEPKATLKIFTTGSVTVTSRSVANVQKAIEKVFPLLHPYRKAKPASKSASATPVATAAAKGMKSVVADASFLPSSTIASSSVPGLSRVSSQIVANGAVKRPNIQLSGIQIRRQH